MDKQELKTTATADGKKMLIAEPVNYCGLTDFSEVTAFQKGVALLLQHFVSEQITEGTMWGDSVQFSISTMFDVLEDIGKYRDDYLKQRIETLEAAMGLEHCGDIDPLE